ncbi:MAG: hypothetical protein FWC93_07430 [Defluviitaleaceae bacterium]|nr:hypothetical protein [Defluviitaleaceae bacterium]
MKNRKIVAKILVFAMFFAVFTYWPVTSVQANIFEVEAGVLATRQLQVDLPQGATDTFVTWGLVSGQGLVIVPRLGTGGAVSLDIFAPEDSAGQIFLAAINVSYMLDGVHAHEERTITVSVADRAPTPTPTPTPQTPVIQMTAPSRYIAMEPGVSRVVNVTLHNNSDFAASRFQILPRVNANFVVEVVGELPSFNLGANAQRSFQLRVTPHASLEGGVFNVPFDITYENNVRTLTRVTKELVVRIEERPETPTIDPRVMITEFTTNPVTIDAGQDFSISAALRNVTRVQANNVQLSVGGFAQAGFVARGATNNFVGGIAANSTNNVSFDMTAGANMTSGSHPITLTLRYDNADGTVRTEEMTFYVTVRSENDRQDTYTERARLAVTAISRPTGIFSVGQEARFEVTIQNNGERAANNLRITAAPDTGIVPRLASVQTLTTLAVGQSHTFTFAFSPTAATNTQFYNIGFTIAYDTGGTPGEGGTAARDSFEQFTGLAVYNPPEDEREPDEDLVRSTPRIIIDRYVLGPDPAVVMANSEFDLTLTILNTHSSRAIGNILVTWQVIGVASGPDAGGGATFIPVESSNTFFIDHIPPRGTYEQHLRLFAIPDAASRNHTITVSFAYEDMDGNEFTASTDIGVNVRQQPQLNLDNVSIQDVATLGSRVNISFNVQNTGRSTLHNLRIRFEGEGIDAGDADRIFGRMEGGMFDNFWGSFFPMVPGQTTVRMIYSFNDDMQVLHEGYQEFPLYVMGGFDEWNGGGDWDRPGWDDPWGEGEGSEGSLWSSPWFWAACGGGLLLVAGGTIAGVAIKRRKNGVDFDLDDYSFDDVDEF